LPLEKSGVGQAVGSAVFFTLGTWLGAEVKTEGVVIKGSSISTGKVSAVLLVLEDVVFVVGLAVAFMRNPMVGTLVLGIAVGANEALRAADGGLALTGALVGAAEREIEGIADTGVLVGAAAGANGNTGSQALLDGDSVGEEELGLTVGAVEEELALIGLSVTGLKVAGLTVTGLTVTGLRAIGENVGFTVGLFVWGAIVGDLVTGVDVGELDGMAVTGFAVDVQVISSQVERAAWVIVAVCSITLVCAKIWPYRIDPAINLTEVLQRMMP
jgi:hypothetical protein